MSTLAEGACCNPAIHWASMWVSSRLQWIENQVTQFVIRWTIVVQQMCIIGLYCTLFLYMIFLVAWTCHWMGKTKLYATKYLVCNSVVYHFKGYVSSIVCEWPSRMCSYYTFYKDLPVLCKTCDRHICIVWWMDNLIPVVRMNVDRLITVYDCQAVVQKEWIKVFL